MLRDAQRLGWVGPAPVDEHIRHALGFARVVRRPPERALDLGSGAGLPGLVLATTWPASSWVLLDGQRRRVAFLDRAITTLGLQERVTAQHARAEDAGRDPDLRGMFTLVTARSFGAPAVTAECGAPFLAVGGVLAVSEPPTSAGERWSAPGLASLGLALEEVDEGTPRVAVLRQRDVCPERFPRRAGVPARRPLF